ncbi:CBS domain protein, partial [Cooperia oncophora]
LLQSVCNRFGLVLAAKTRHATLILFIVFAPLAWPLSKLIDYFLGREVREIYSEEKLKTLIKVQAKKMEEAAQDILARIADFPKKTVEDMMTPMEDTFVISSSDRLDVKVQSVMEMHIMSGYTTSVIWALLQLLVTILEKGYTRIPVFEEKNRLNLTAVLNVKDLATMTIDHRSTVQQFMSKIDDSRKQMRFVLASQRGEALMQEMMKGDQHLCAVMKFSYGRYRVVGLITLEDVIEEVFGDIEDDSDKMWNNRRAGVHKDQQTLDWFRTSEAEQFAGLGVNATLRLIQ